MTEKIITYAIIGAIVGLTMSYLKKGAGEKVDSSYNGHFLRMNKFYTVLGVVTIVLGLLIEILLIIGKEFALTPLPVLMFCLPGLVCLLYYRNHYLKFDNFFIETQTWLGKKALIHWVDIQKISFSPLSGQLTITDKHGASIKIHQHIVGLVAFVKAMEDKTSQTAKGLKLPF